MAGIDLNFWDDYQFEYLDSIRNKIEQWNGPDCEETLKKVEKNPKFKTYGKSDFFYRRNSYGFRSEEFDNSDDVKILYAGCSLTEGVGLPVEHTWAHFVNSFIGGEIGRKPKMYNIGYGGFSIDSIIRFTYLTIKNGVFNPDVVLLLLPSITRNEILFRNEHGSTQMYNYISTFAHDSEPQLRILHENQTRAFLPSQRMHETFRNLLFLKEFLDARNIPFYFQTWDNTKLDFGKHFLGFSDVLSIASPKVIRDHVIPSTMIFDFSDVTIKYELPFKQNIGRDGMHPGPNYHWNFSKEFYAGLKKKEAFTKVLEKWKK